MSLKNDSKRDWSATNPASVTNDELKIGCLQRIADATEAMAKDREMMERMLAHRKAQVDSLVTQRQRLERRLAATQGVVTKMKRRIAELEGGGA